MLIRLEKIVDEPFSWQSQCSIPEELLERPELVELSEIDWSGRVERADPGFRFWGELSYRQTLACVRCLAPIEQPVAETVELTILVRAPQPMDGEHELTKEELDTLYLEDDEFDLEPILMEQLQLNIPMRVLCSEDCAGLCLVCGGNRNKTLCNCEDQITDPRWDVLKSVKGN